MNRIEVLSQSHGYLRVKHCHKVFMRWDTRILMRCLIAGIISTFGNNAIPEKVMPLHNLLYWWLEPWWSTRPRFWHNRKWTMNNCVKASIPLNFILVVVVFYLCLHLKWSLNCWVFLSVFNFSSSKMHMFLYLYTELWPNMSTNNVT